MLSALLAQRDFIPGEEVGTGQFEGVPTIQGFEAIVANIVTSVLGFGAIALFILLLIGGFKFITAGGNPEAAESAKKTLTSAIIGVVILAAAYLILVLLSSFTGIDLTNFVVRER